MSIVCVFFFFKQKTAYEMRISDWSSDVCSSDLADLPGPWSVTGEIAAGGEGAPKVNAREAVRIFTGAAMPKGADCVLIQEDAEPRNGTLILTGSGPDRPGKHVSAQRSDFLKGTLLLRKGSVIRAPQVARTSTRLNSSH